MEDVVNLERLVAGLRARIQAASDLSGAVGKNVEQPGNENVSAVGRPSESLEASSIAARELRASALELLRMLEQGFSGKLENSGRGRVRSSELERLGHHALRIARQLESKLLLSALSQSTREGQMAQPEDGRLVDVVDFAQLKQAGLYKTILGTPRAPPACAPPSTAHTQMKLFSMLRNSSAEKRDGGQAPQPYTSHEAKTAPRSRYASFLACSAKSYQTPTHVLCSLPTDDLLVHLQCGGF